MPLKKVWELLTTPLLPELPEVPPSPRSATSRRMDQWVDLGWDFLRELTTPGEIVATAALGGGGLTRKIPKYGPRIVEMITSSPARTAAKSYISADMIENIPFDDVINRGAGVDLTKLGVYGSLAALPWGLDRIGRKAVKAVPPKSMTERVEIPPVDEGADDILDLAELHKDSDKFNEVMKKRDPNVKLRYADGRKVGVEPYLRQLGAYRDKTDATFKALAEEIEEVPIEKLDVAEFPELRRGNYVTDPLEKQTLELARSKLYPGPGAAGRPPTGEDLWKLHLSGEKIPDEQLPEVFGYLRGLGLLKGAEGQKFSPDRMRAIINAAGEREGLKKELKRLQRTALSPENELRLNKNMPFEEATYKFANHWRIAKVLGGKQLAKQHLDNFKDYLRATGLEGREDVQKIVKNIRDTRRSKTLDWFTNLGQLTKGLRLVGGVPGTALNYHGVGIAMRTLFDSHSPTMKTVATMINPRIAQRELDEMGDAILDFQRSGVSFQTERDVRLHEGIESTIGASWSDIAPVSEGGWMDKVTEAHDKAFGAPLFERVLPVLKINTFKNLRDDLVKQGMSLDSASYNAARTVNSKFGGVDRRGLVWKNSKGEYVARSRELSQIMRAGLLAGDWFETNRRHFIAAMPKPALRMFNQMMPDDREIDLLTDVERSRLRKQAYASVVGIYTTMSLAQKAATGHFIHENPRGKRWHFQTPFKDSKGKTMYIPIALGTSQDYARIPTELVQEGAEGDIPNAFGVLSSRLSQPAKLGVNLLKGTDFANRPLRGPDRYGNPQPFSRQAANYARELVDTIIPQYADAMIGYGTDEYSGLQALTQGLEVPVQFHRPYHRRRAPR